MGEAKKYSEKGKALLDKEIHTPPPHIVTGSRAERRKLLGPRMRDATSLGAHSTRDVKSKSYRKVRY